MAAQETVDLAIGSLANAIDLLGNVYSDLRDALNEFVSNAYDEFRLAGMANGVVHIKLMPKSKPPRIIVGDNGRGIARPDLIRIARSIASSSKPGPAGTTAQTIGEKGIGILGFQALADRCHIITRHVGSRGTLRLELAKGQIQGTLHEVDRESLLEIPGTEVHLLDISEQVFRVLTLPKLVEYFRDRWRQPLASEVFSLVIAQGKRSERVRPGKFDGELFLRRARTDLGNLEFELYLSPKTQRPKRAAVVGAGGVQILRDLTLDPAFTHHPWSSDQLEGEIRFPALRQTTGRRGLQHDRKVFPLFLAAIQAVEGEVARQLDRLNREQDSVVDSRLTRAIRQAFRKALAEIEALSTSGLKVKVADPSGEEGQGDLFADETAATAEGAAGVGEAAPPGGGEGGGEGGPSPEKDVVGGAKGRTRQSSTVGLNYLPVPFEGSSARSRYNSALKLLEINSAHPDYRRARQHDRRTFLDYLVVLIAKELALLNYAGIDPAELMEKYAELLATVQLHLPKRV